MTAPTPPNMAHRATTPGPPLDVLVLMGGWSPERAVSLASGEACARALERLGHRVRRLDLARNVTTLVDALAVPPDVVFNALHGHGGEDGTVQGVLEMAGVPYTHSGVLASALAMDKAMAKQVFTAAGLQTPAGRVMARDHILDGESVTPPVVVKPIAEGSSWGVHICQTHADLAALSGANDLGASALVEPFVPGRELTVAVMADTPLGVTEIRPVAGFYDYDAKYVEGRAEHVLPADIPAAVEAAALTAAATAHRVLGCRGVTRADFRYDDRDASPGGLYLLEVNTQPGMTDLSLVPEQAAHVGLDFDTLCAWILAQATTDEAHAQGATNRSGATGESGETSGTGPAGEAGAP